MFENMLQSRILMSLVEHFWIGCDDEGCDFIRCSTLELRETMMVASLIKINSAKGDRVHKT